MLDITEVLCHRKSGLCDTHTRSRRLVHLSEHQRGLINDTRALHLGPEVITLSGTLSYSCKNGISAMLRRNIADQLLNEHRLADTCTSEQSDLTTLCIRGKQVNDLDAGLEHFYDRALLLEARRLSVDTPVLLLLQLLTAVDRIAEHVEQSSQRLLSYRNFDTASGSRYFHILMQPFTGSQHNTAHHIITDVLRHFHHAALPVVGHFQCILDVGQITVCKFHINDRTRYLNDFSFLHNPKLLLCSAAAFPASASAFSASAPSRLR